ncbi:CLUMA_CG007332, isoform A [Clunio marinus]|uniref:CLUMA_CG007332, isoform A n=1 Tax=Clunio marinus TaxID=568069 RepID=A0A1J1I0K8_9DIPT|nr:CLUMA_CG007332, isoform A [Clunio marinus]
MKVNLYLSSPSPTVLYHLLQCLTDATFGLIYDSIKNDFASKLLKFRKWNEQLIVQLPILF